MQERCSTKPLVKTKNGKYKFREWIESRLKFKEEITKPKDAAGQTLPCYVDYMGEMYY